MAVVAITYPSLPDPMLSHYDAAGNVTVWEPKNWGSALSGRTPRAAREFQDGRGKALQRALAALTLVSVLLLSTLAVAPIVRLAPSGISWTVWGLVAASSLPVVWLVIDSVRQGRALRAAPEASGPESPDDYHLWRWGIFYENREDPRMWVEKRNGLGLTVNLGHPGGVAIMGGLALMVLATVAMVITL